jgi:hypothetical protein
MKDTILLDYTGTRVRASSSGSPLTMQSGRSRRGRSILRDIHKTPPSLVLRWTDRDLIAPVRSPRTRLMEKKSTPHRLERLGRKRSTSEVERVQCTETAKRD